MCAADLSAFGTAEVLDDLRRCAPMARRRTVGRLCGVVAALAGGRETDRADDLVCDSAREIYARSGDH